MMKDVLRKNMNQAGFIILFLVALGLLAGCVLHKPFEFFDESTSIKSGTIAVISADGSDATRRLAAALTKELRERSTFKVWSQAKINLSLAIRVVTIAELVGAVTGIGHQLSVAQELFSVADVFAWTLVLVALLFLLEAMVARVEARVLRWRA